MLPGCTIASLPQFFFYKLQFTLTLSYPHFPYPVTQKHACVSVSGISTKRRNLDGSVLCCQDATTEGCASIPSGSCSLHLFISYGGRPTLRLEDVGYRHKRNRVRPSPPFELLNQHRLCRTPFSVFWPRSGNTLAVIPLNPPPPQGRVLNTTVLLVKLSPPRVGNCHEQAVLKPCVASPLIFAVGCTRKKSSPGWVIDGRHWRPLRANGAAWTSSSSLVPWVGFT